MVFVRRRLLFWLIKAYLKKWGKSILASFFIGLGIFFILIHYRHVFFSHLIPSHEQRIGIIGSYTLDTLPPSVVEKLSRGLTKIAEDGTPHPDVAQSWSIQNNGKTYIFKLKKNLVFNDKSKVESSSINYPFADVTVKRPDSHTITFTLKESYSPFLITASRPIYKSGYVGIGEYTIKDIELNGSFVKYVLLQSTKDNSRITYLFYPSEEALKLAFALGEISHGEGITNLSVKKNLSLSGFNNAVIEKKVDTTRLVTLFIDTKDSVTSDSKIRNALSYATPDTFSDGKRNYGPFSPLSWAYTSGLSERSQDIVHAQKLLKESALASDAASLSLSLKTLPRYKKTAEELTQVWKALNIETKIEVVDSIPDTFQLFLGDFKIPKDPDQYSLWHRNQENNITHFENIRIDKLLEDGRKTTDVEERKKIYADFQKYLIPESPAIFLYFPYEFTVKKK